MVKIETGVLISKVLIENSDYYLVFLDVETLQVVECNTGNELFAFNIDNFTNSVSLTYDQYPEAWKILFKVISYYVFQVKSYKEEYKPIVGYLKLLHKNHTPFINLVLAKLVLIDVNGRIGQLGFERDYYNASQNYLQLLLSPYNWDLIRNNQFFRYSNSLNNYYNIVQKTQFFKHSADEEFEIQFVYVHEKSIQEAIPYIELTSHPIELQYNYRIKTIYDFLLERYNFKEVYSFMKQFRPIVGKFLFYINCPQVIIFFLLFILLSYPTNIVWFLQFGLWGIIGMGSFYTIVYPLFYLLFRYKSAYHDLSLIAPKFIISILIGWVALLPFADEIWKLNMSTIDSPDLFYFIIFTLGVIIYSFIFYELKMVKPFISLRESISRISRLFSIGFPVSILAGLLFMSFSFIPNVGDAKFYSDNVASSRLIRDVEKIEANYKKSLEDYYVLSYLREEKNLDSIKSRLLLVKSCINETSRIEKMNMPNVQHYVDSSYEAALDKSRILYNNKKGDIYNKLCEYESKEWTKKGNNSFCCMNILNVMNLYIFPKLLLLMSLTTFLLGYFIQFVFEGRSLRKN